MLYEKATAALKHAFDHKEGCTVTFSLKVKKRAEEVVLRTGQGKILAIKDSEGIHRNIIPKYGQLTLSDIRNSMTCYHLQSTTAAQNLEAFAKILLTHS